MNLKKPIDNHKPMAYIISMIPKDFKKWREANGFSQSRLAETLSVHTMTISRWERGVREIPPFLHLALRCLELEGGESTEGKKKKGKERRLKK
jgi:transcriptional regulator with XRE-family HTH domain